MGKFFPKFFFLFSSCWLIKIYWKTREQWNIKVNKKVFGTSNKKFNKFNSFRTRRNRSSIWMIEMCPIMEKEKAKKNRGKCTRKRNNEFYFFNNKEVDRNKWSQLFDRRLLRTERGIITKFVKLNLLILSPTTFSTSLTHEVDKIVSNPSPPPITLVSPSCRSIIITTTLSVCSLSSSIWLLRPQFWYAIPFFFKSPTQANLLCS